MTMIDPAEPLHVQVEKQARIIDALVRRASRQNEVGLSAFSAFQSAIDLQRQVAAQSRELESVRIERERTRKTLVEALGSMEEGFALFSEERLDVCNDLFRSLLPDISHKVVPGIALGQYLDLMEVSRHLVSTDRRLSVMRRALRRRREAVATVALVAELSDDRWYQMSVQQTSAENTVLLLTDITALVRRNRDEKEHLIDRQADYLAAVFETMSSGVCAFSETGAVTLHNQRFRDMLGLSLAVLQPGTRYTTLLETLSARGMIGAEALTQVEQWRAELMETGELSGRLRHGAERVLHVQANVLPDGGVLVELKDVTLQTRNTALLEDRVLARTAQLTQANARLTEQYEEKARVEEELRLAKERAEAAVSSKTRFLAAASHDLLQPINAAKLLISTLKETTRDTRFQPMVSRLEGSFASAEYLLHSLLDISRLDSADLDAVSVMEVDLGALIEGVRADQMGLAQQKGVRLDVVLTSVFVRSDPVYLLRSVQNLVVNALQYTGAGGRVLVGCRKRAGRVVLEVWDTGVGIARKDQARIFDEFTRAGTMPLGSGMGLGLSVVDRACRLLGHRLSVRSKPGHGSVFSIEMETVDGPPRPATRRAPEPEPAPRGIDHIVLVIENDADVLYGTVQWLEQWGASVFPAATAEEALAHVTDMGLPPDIILADYQLDGGATGIEAIARIRTMTGHHVPAILITADRSEAVRRRGAAMDATVMTKPAELTRLKPLITSKIRRAAASGGRQMSQVTAGSGDFTKDARED